MKNAEDENILFFNQELMQFEIRIDNELAKIEFQILDDRIFLTHTEVPEKISGKGIGTHLMKKSMDEIEKRKLKVVPACSFAIEFIRKNSHYRKLLAPGIIIE